MKNMQNHRRGSSPHQEKEIGSISNQIELSFSVREQETAIKFDNMKKSRHEKSTETQTFPSVDSSTK